MRLDEDLLFDLVDVHVVIDMKTFGQALRSTYSARWARSRPLWAWRWSRCTGWSGSGRIRSSRATRWRCAGHHRSSPSACCRPASAPPYPPATTGWWAWVSLKQGTPAPPSRPPAPPSETCPAARSGSEELRKRKTEEGLIRGSRKAADGAAEDGQGVSVCLWAKHVCVWFGMENQMSKWWKTSPANCIRNNSNATKC